MKKLFVSDVDNTLLDETLTEFSDLFKDCLNKIKENDDLFVLCSGRPTYNLIQLANGLRADGIDLKYVAGYNGVEIYDLEQDKVVTYSGFQLNEVEEICNYLDKKNLDYMIYDQDILRTNSPSHPMTIREATFTGTPIGDLSKLCASPKVLVVVDPKDNQEVLEMISGDLTQYEVFNSMTCFVEIVKKNVNKSTALKEISKLENVDRENTYGFGDGGNDLELLRYANVGIAVENGSDVVKMAADEIIGPVWEDSVAKYIDKLLKKQ